jgi:hypothetical protein
MKTAFLAVMLIGSVVLGTHEVQAQAYGSYYYPPSWNEAQYQGYAQEYDPYYELHVLHYQLYLPQYQPYPTYPSCCFAAGVGTPRWSPPIIPPPQVIISPRPPAPMRRR